ncbi:hypothetical protein NliqN6_2418 [Naganishia liquefaciens]|uniref:Rab-GAP TBC domain-containing protein n=1 Tax=Naganishia liquefaciens TaxID=104408 RepID=A0A8H3TS79_9TREE|nr:hypothetical protein NliqN6_2418 [Naganishia liquefaciens]
MSAFDQYPDLPSPTNRDSAASAIFNLYGYSKRDSSQLEEKRPVSQANGLNGHDQLSQGGRTGSADDGLVEELQSPRVEEPHRTTESKSHTWIDGISNSKTFSTPDTNSSPSSNRPQSMALAPSLPVFSQAEDPANRRHSSAVLHSQAQDAQSRVKGSFPKTSHPFMAMEEERSAYLTVPTVQPEPATNQEDALIGRQPGEEEDAYHVRSTYARLEVQGVYGDGWDEGVERTRGRAIKDDRRSSQAIPAKSDALSEQERKALSKVDRYGFFDQALKTRQENRVYRIPAQAFRKTPKVPKSPPARAEVDRSKQDIMAGGSEDTTGAVPEAISPAEIERLTDTRREMFRRKEAERIGKWERMLLVADRDTGGNAVRWKWEAAGKGRKLTKRVYKGIPDRWRSAAWSALIEAKTRQPPSSLPKQHGTSDSSERYRTASDVASSYDVQIDLDVPRTISGHILFHTRYGHGQRSLFNVLHSFSTYCSECGYCQGMGPIAATFLCYFDPPRVYTSMVRLHDAYDMHGIFIHGFPGLLENFYVQERLIEHMMPDVYSAFEKHMISASSYATKWYITLFANSVPFQTQLRIWDCLLLDGQDVLVMTSLALIYAFRAVLTAVNASFETILSTLSAFYIPEDEDLLMQWIHKMMMNPETRSMMAGWRKHWQELVRNKEERSALL